MVLSFYIIWIKCSIAKFLAFQVIEFLELLEHFKSLKGEE